MVLVILAGLVACGAGFILLWSLGSWAAGGPGFPWRPKATATEVSLPPPIEAATEAAYGLEPLVDRLAFRDLSYTPVKGIYVGSYPVGSSKRLQELLEIANTTEINAFVIDVKDDWGKLTYAADVPLARESGLIEQHIKDIDALIATLGEHGIVPIARIVCFKDTSLAQAKPEVSVRSSKGGKWADWNGLHYTNPYSHEVWDYLVQVAEDAARHGFREIQFDYVRFPTDGPISEAVYPGEYCARTEAIAGFLAFARERLEKLGVWVSADVFGIVITNTADAAVIGQNYSSVSQNVDILCPMIYPSHYYSGSYGLDNPNASPYELVTAATKETVKRLAGTGAMGRPWLQDFSIGGITYGVEKVKAQIKAAEEQGFSEWLLWNPAAEYTVGALRGE